MSSSFSKPLFRHVTIIGLGLLGGSLGLLMKEKGLAGTIAGIGRRKENLQLALRLGAIDDYTLDPLEAIKESDCIILAIPVETYIPQIENWGRELSPSTIVSDVGSVKGRLVSNIESLLPPSTYFVGAHPIAGKEKSGVAYADSRLFEGARCVLTPTSRTDAGALEKMKCLWEAAGSIVLYMDPMEHDRVLGAVSHLPHIAAFSLMHTLENLQSRTNHQTDLLDFSGGGLRDTTRIAASSPEMWRDICLANQENLEEMVDLYIQQLEEFRKLLKNRDASGLFDAIKRSKELRDRLR